MGATLGIATLGTGVDQSGLRSGLREAERGTRGWLSGIGGVFKNALGTAFGFGIFNAVKGAMRGVGEIITEAMPLETIESAFEGIAATGKYTGQEVLGAMEDASHGMVAQRDLMKSYNQAAQLVSVQFADQLPDAMQYLGKVSAATGQDMGYMLDSLVRGVGRLSPMILDNLAVQVDLTSANEAYAKSIGKNVSDLTKQEQQTALMTQVLEKLAENTAAMPDVAGTAQQEFAAWQATLQNTKDTIGKALIPVILPFLQKLTELGSTVIPVLVGWLQGSLLPILEQFGGSLSGIQDIAGFLGPTLSSAFELAKQLLTSLKDAWESDFAGIRTLVETVFASIGPAIQGALAVVKGIFDALTAALRGDWDAVGEHLKTAWDTAWETIKTTASNVGPALLETLKGILENIAEAVKSIDWKKVGSSIVKGIGQGLTSMIGWLKEQAQKVIDALGSAVKKLLGIGSPSKLFAEQVGKPLAQGISVGWEREMGNLQKMMGAQLGRFEVAPQYAAAQGSRTVQFFEPITITDRQDDDAFKDSLSRVLS